jgi:hypothetical protein
MEVVSHFLVEWHHRGSLKHGSSLDGVLVPSQDELRTKGDQFGKGHVRCPH